MKTKNLLFALSLLAAAGCSSPAFNVELASEQEASPSPHFTVSLADKNVPLSYSRIRVYDITEGCLVPNCPVVWSVVVSERNSPSMITYGVVPSFGSFTVIPPKRLAPGRRYEMIADQSELIPNRAEGRLTFSVSEDGEVKKEAPASR